MPPPGDFSHATLHQKHQTSSRALRADHSNSLYYEDQKAESLRKSKDYVTNRLPKFLGYFERVLQSNVSGSGPWLYGGNLTYADLVLFQVRNDRAVWMLIMGRVSTMTNRRLTSVTVPRRREIHVSQGRYQAPEIFQIRTSLRTLPCCDAKAQHQGLPG